MGGAILFADLKISGPLLRAVGDLGYVEPTPIQLEAIPVLLAGRDLIGQAQTGTGKTAAFALPLLMRVEADLGVPQVLVLAPTRELALQVGGAFQDYAKYLDALHVLTIYGGQAYGPQLRGLRQGAQIVVGTPGRLIDHLERGALRLDALRTLVLDEGDEMLRMGFIEDVEKILAAAPPNCQKALFSATMPAPIREIAWRHLHDPVEIRIASKTATVETISQYYILLKEEQKPEALLRLLEMEEQPAALIFTRTKAATVEVAEHLRKAGFLSAALNGDMSQELRESAITRLRSGELNIVVATDVAARGLDVERIGLVINYDIPLDVEPYVHRIGRTGRAGRSGKAFLFVTPGERRYLKIIERVTGQRIEETRVPQSSDLERKRTERFRARLEQLMAQKDLSFYRATCERLTEETGLLPEELAPALLYMAQGTRPLRVPKGVFDRAPVPPPARPRRKVHPPQMQKTQVNRKKAHGFKGQERKKAPSHGRSSRPERGK